MHLLLAGVDTQRCQVQDSLQVPEVWPGRHLLLLLLLPERGRPLQLLPHLVLHPARLLEVILLQGVLKKKL